MSAVVTRPSVGCQVAGRSGRRGDDVPTGPTTPANSALAYSGESTRIGPSSHAVAPNWCQPVSLVITSSDSELNFRDFRANWCGRGDSNKSPASTCQTMPDELVSVVLDRPTVPTGARSRPGIATGIATGNCSQCIQRRTVSVRLGIAPQQFSKLRQSSAVTPLSADVSKRRGVWLARPVAYSSRPNRQRRHR